MLKEYVKVRQEAHGFRRLFTDDAFDLWVWYEGHQGGPLYGFQLVIAQDMGENTVFTWTTDKGALYAGLMDGDNRGEGLRYKKTPFLALNGTMNRDKVLSGFRGHAAELPQDIRTLVERELEAFVP